MPFQKQVLVLKNVLESTSIKGGALVGIARIEVDGGVGELFLSLINVPTILDAQFFALVIDQDEKLHSFELGARPVSSVKLFENVPSIEKGVAVGIYAVKDCLPVCVAFCKSDNSDFSLSQFKKQIAERQLLEIKSKKTKEKEGDVFFDKTDNLTQKTQTPLSYDDEVVATENYFLYEQNASKNIKRIKDFEQNAPIKDELFNSPSAQETCKERENFNGVQNETGVSSSTKHSHSNNYFERVQKDLIEVFEKHPEETPLIKLFANSKWAKINYSKDKYYVVGLIKEHGKEKYICYGVPAVYSPTPPEQLKGYCSFVPQSIFNMTGQGYWMLFQDACSGKCVLHE